MSRILRFPECPPRAEAEPGETSRSIIRPLKGLPKEAEPDRLVQPPSAELRPWGRTGGEEEPGFSWLLRRAV